MGRVTIEWVGTKKLQKMLEASGKKAAIRRAVRKNTMQLHERALSNERKAYIKGYWTGNTARQTTMSIMGLEGRVTVNTTLKMGHALWPRNRQSSRLLTFKSVSSRLI